MSPRRAEAIAAAQHLAEANRPSEVVVYGFDSEIDERSTYARVKDPDASRCAARVR
jgi:hypothetical protein